MWPEADAVLVRDYRRSRVAGPPPIPPEAPSAPRLLGRHLRHAPLAVLLRHDGPLSLTEIHRALHLAGYAIGGRRPVQVLADALGYEHDIGRVRRIARGVYSVDEDRLTPRARRRLLDDDAQATSPGDALVPRGRHDRRGASSARRPRPPRTAARPPAGDAIRAPSLRARSSWS